MVTDMIVRSGQLLSTLRQHFATDTGEDDLEDYVADMPMANILPCLPILMPPLFEVAGMVFQNLVWYGGTPEEPEAVVQRNLDEQGGDHQMVQRILNEVELGRLFRKPWDPMELEGIRTPLYAPITSRLDSATEAFLADCIADSWRGWLLLNYPNRQFTVEVLPETHHDGIAVTFFEQHRAQSAYP